MMRFYLVCQKMRKKIQKFQIQGTECGNIRNEGKNANSANSADSEENLSDFGNYSRHHIEGFYFYKKQKPKNTTKDSNTQIETWSAAVAKETVFISHLDICFQC